VPHPRSLLIAGILVAGLLLGNRWAPRDASAERIFSQAVALVPFVGLPRRAAQQAYAGSYTATLALIGRHGISRVRDLLEALTGHRDFARAFESVLHERYRDFEATRMGAQTGRRF